MSCGSGPSAAGGAARGGGWPARPGRWPRSTTPYCPGQAPGRLARARGISAEEAEQLAASTVSIGRMVTAEEVADVVAFLASPRNVALNGDPVVASGGMRGPIHY
ncbi:SDR family oxidoreductase [Streptomyces canus]|uniref:SDR family oxidoreductase n=1 Tax=Streptomyces canus TaxID=58343 RepID=UPI0036EEBEFB